MKHFNKIYDIDFDQIPSYCKKKNYKNINLNDLANLGLRKLPCVYIAGQMWQPSWPAINAALGKWDSVLRSTLSQCPNLHHLTPTSATQQPLITVPVIWIFKDPKRSGLPKTLHTHVWRYCCSCDENCIDDLWAENWFLKLFPSYSCVEWDMLHSACSWQVQSRGFNAHCSGTLPCATINSLYLEH